MDKSNIVVLTESEKKERAKLSHIVSKNASISANVYSYMKGKSVKSAITSIRSNINKFEFFIKVDIKSYFESINKKRLEFHLNQQLEENIVMEIMKVLNEDEKKYKKKGLIVGSPLSNILSNLYLYEIDKYFSGKVDTKYYRFADDILILSNERISIEEIEMRVKEEKLTLNLEKVVIGSYGDAFTFLGEEIKKDKDSILKQDNNISDILSDFKKKKIDKEDREKLYEKVKGMDNPEYQYLYRYKFGNEDENELIEEMLDLNLYKEVYKFKEMIERIDDGVCFDKVQALFGENGIYYKSKISDGNLDYEKLEEAFTSAVYLEHLEGNYTLAKRLNENRKSDILVIDIDNKNSLEKAEKDAREIKKVLAGRGIDSYIEYSGMKGYHVWIFFESSVEIEELNTWIEKVLKGIEFYSNIEFRPKDNIIAQSEQIIKLPLGIHPISNERSKFIDIENVSDIDKNMFINYEENLIDFWNIAKDEYKNLYNISQRCSIVKDIITYGIIERNIAHTNRLVLSYIFTNIEDGREYLHLIMENMINYNYKITDKFIDKAPENPISCRKLKEYFKGDDIKCQNCIFDKVGAYKTPILHCENNEFIEAALQKEIKVLISSMVEFQKEKKTIDDKLKKLNKRLTGLYSQLEGNEVQIDIGKLKKYKDKWIIEIGDC